MDRFAAAALVEWRFASQSESGHRGKGRMDTNGARALAERIAKEQHRRELEAELKGPHAGLEAALPGDGGDEPPIGEADAA
jgi:hypothetical protein